MKKASQKGFTLIELLVVIGILAVLLTAVLIAINPVRQFQKARDSQRHNDVLAILNAIGQDMADNKGTFNGPAIPVGVGNAVVISKANFDACSVLMPTYISSLPANPPAAPITDCSLAYSTGYFIYQDASGRITVFIGAETPGDPQISVTR